MGVSIMQFPRPLRGRGLGRGGWRCIAAWLQCSALLATLSPILPLKGEGVWPFLTEGPDHA